MQIADGGDRNQIPHRIGELTEEIDLIVGQGELRIRPEISGDFGSLRFLDPDLAGLQRRILRPKPGKNLRPDQRRLSGAVGRESGGQNTSNAGTPHDGRSALRRHDSQHAAAR